MYYFKSLSYFLHRFVFQTRFLVGHAEKYGLSMRFRAPDGGGRKIYKRGIYEEDFSDFLLCDLTLTTDDVVLDIGANIGWYSVLLSKYFPQARIFSFEPDPENFHCFQSNIERNACTNITSVEKGAGEATETKTLYLYKKSNVGRHSMLSINEGPTIEVQVVSLDEFLRDQQVDLSKIKFLKIDIEGYELNAFKGARKVLENVPMIMAEFSPGYMRKGGLEPEELLDFLADFGFTPFELIDGQLQPADKSALLARDKNVNLIWKR